MAKSRVRKSEKRRLERKAQHAVSVETATRIRTIAEQMRDNAMLRTLLLQEKDASRRRQLFDFMLPYLRFENPEFPSPLDPESRIIRP